LRHKHRRHLVAVQAIEDAARLLGVDQLGVDRARRGDRVLDRLLGDLVEHHPPHRHLGLEHLVQVPGDRLSFAIFIGREVQLGGLGQQVLQLLDLGLLLGRHDVQRHEAVLDVDAGAGPRLAAVRVGDLVGPGRQVADVADRRLDDRAATEEAADGLRLGRRLDDDERGTHGGRRSLRDVGDRFNPRGWPRRPGATRRSVATGENHSPCGWIGARAIAPIYRSA
jgi:hypothetical protein